MVAHTHHPFIDFCRIVDRNWWRLGSCSVHLYTVLKMAPAQDRYKTILVMVTGLLAIALIFKLQWLVIGCLIIGVLASFIPAAARGIEWGWMKFALALGWVNSRILLSIIYFVFLLPIAWISRLFTKDPLALKRRTTSSLFVTRNHLYTKKDLENIW
jgi:hypothetical protein